MLKNAVISIIMLCCLSIKVCATQWMDSVLMVTDSDVASVDLHLLSDADEFMLTWHNDSAIYHGITIVKHNSKFDDRDLSQSVTLTLFTAAQDNKTILAEHKIALDGNLCGLRIKTDGQITRIFGGHNSVLFNDIHIPLAITPGTIYKLHAPHKSKNVVMRKDIAHRIASPKVDFTDINSLNNYLSQSRDSLESYWQYLDCSAPNNGVKVTGKYQIATVRHNNGYQIINLTDNDIWAPLTVRGYLHPTPFINHFDLEWIDSHRLNSFKDETSATISENETILELSFPLLGTKIRFRRSNPNQF